MTEKLFDVVIVAGGLATRLYPLTEKIPKALINIQGEPFIAHQLRLLKKQNIQRVVICVGYLGDLIKDYVDDGKKFQLQVCYSSDSEKLLGTAGAIKKATSQLSDHFFVLYGDSFLPCDYHAVQLAFLQSQKDALMTVFHNQCQWDSSNVEFYQNEIKSYDKKNKTPNMQYIDYGLGIFNKTVFDDVPENAPYDLADLYQLLLKKNKLAAFEIKERFYEIGSFSGISELENYLLCHS